MSRSLTGLSLLSCKSPLITLLYSSMNLENRTIRTRFAPSPTGFVHIGNFRTGLFSHLWAKHNNGISILRIEDTDQKREVEGATEHLLKVIKTMGIEFDEGFYLTPDGQVSERGEHGPYLQSKRLELYTKYAKQLVDEKKAYYCFCTEERLAELRVEQTALKKPPMYDRHCLKLTESEIQSKLEDFKANGGNCVIRFFIPEGKTEVKDLIYGTIQYENKVLDDQVILKSDGFPTYHLAVVVDDHAMEITHVIRGEEWISSTPKHILLYQALGWEPTEFGHAPLILNPDKSKLSKRQGDVTVEDYLKKGYFPEALTNFVAFLGWNPKTEQEIFSLQELTEQFDLTKVNKSGAVFDIHKLDWISSQYIRKVPTSDLAEKLLPYWKEGGIDTEKYSKDYFIGITKLEQERLKKLSEIGERTHYFFVEPEYEAGLLTWKKSTPEDANEKLQKLLILLNSLGESAWTKEGLEKAIQDFIQENSFDVGSVLWPLRVALTGMQASPGPFEVASTLALGLGTGAVLKRIEKAIAQLT